MTNYGKSKQIQILVIVSSFLAKIPNYDMPVTGMVAMKNNLSWFC